ncbi:hypothetical protein ACEQ8H_005593 [Pleosporales sp. CAS-2024a]
MEVFASQDVIFRGFADQFFGDFETFSASDHGMNTEEGFAAGMDRDSPDWLDSDPTDIHLDPDNDVNPQVLGHSSDMDPYLLQNYQYDRKGEFRFKQLMIRSVRRTTVPAQFVLSQPGLFKLSREELGLDTYSPQATRAELEALVSVETGLRLIALFRDFILPQYPIFAENHFPDSRTSPPHLLAAIYMVSQPFAKFDDVLSVELAYEALNSQALAKLIETALSSLRAIHETASNIQITLRIAKSLLAELSEWHQNCPQQDPEDDGDNRSLHTVCILGFNFIQMTIFRAIMRPFVVTAASGEDVTQTSDEDLATQQEVTGFVRTGMRCSTTAAANFVRALKEEHFHMFWPQWSQVAFSCICFLNLLMATTAPTMEESNSWFRELHTARREIRLKSNMLPALRLGLLRIDALFWKGIDSVLHLKPHVKDALRASLDLRTS